MAVTWLTPKTNWVQGDSFEPSDYNRILNNIKYVNEHLNVPISLEDMGADATYDNMPWDYKTFNAIENNLHNVNVAFENGFVSIGFKKTFYPNGAFISVEELNRIETALVNIKNTQEILKANSRRLPFRLGAFKQIRL